MALLMAYIGKAAHNIGGTTIHSALHLPLLTNSHATLSSEKLNALSTHYQNLRLVVFEEISLIGAKTFHLADSRLRSIMHKPTKPFGGLDVLLYGDLCQASPVKDNWIFKPSNEIFQACTHCFVSTSLNKQCDKLTSTSLPY